MNFKQVILFLVGFFIFGLQKYYSQCLADAGADVQICPAGNVQIGGLTAASGGTGPYTILWSPATDLSCIDCPNPISTSAITRTYTLTITDALGCVDTDNVTVTATPNPTANFNFTGGNNQCANLPISFTNTSVGGVTYSWNFGDPASGIANTSVALNATHTFTAVGETTQDFTVTLIATNAAGCQSTSSQVLTVRQTPGPNLIDPATGFRNCNGAGASVDFTVFDITTSTTGTNFQIIWDDGSADYNDVIAPNGITHTYNTPEVFDLQYIVTNGNGCRDTTIIPVANIGNPSVGAANPGGTLGCAPLEICFPVSNFAGNHPTTSYIIDFGDGSTFDTLSHPPPNSVCHSYLSSSCPEPGNSYTFTIRAVNLCNTSQATINPIQVYEPPIANLSASPLVACVNSPVSFINNSNLGFNSQCSQFTTFVWNFGDGTANQTINSFLSNGTFHSFDEPGTYTISVTTSNSCGASTDQITVCIEEPPIPDFTVDVNTDCVPFVVSTNDLSVISNDCATFYSWSSQFIATSCSPFSGSSSFANGTNANSLEPQFQFSSPGQFQIQLMMTNSCGNFFATEPIIAQAPPDISINPVSSICGGQTVNPSAQVNECLESVDTYLWTFPGSNTASSGSLNPGAITYPDNGAYTISLTATNACGSDVSTVGLTVNDVPPVLNPFTVSPLCEGYDAEFFSDNVSNASYSWSGPNGFSSNQQNPIINNVTAANAGLYSVFASFGSCSGPTQSVNLVILPITFVSAGPNFSRCVDATPFVIASATPAGGTWSGPGVQPNGLFDPSNAGVGNHNLIYTYTDPVTLCTYSGNLNATVNGLPVVQAGIDLSLCNQPIANALTPITPLNGVWTGPGVTDPAGEFTPSTNGTFEVVYSFTNANGCVNRDTILVTVNDATQANAGLDSTICENGNNVQLSGQPIGGTWTGTGISAGGNFNPSVQGTFTMTYTFGSGTCQTSDEMDFIINPAPLVDAGLNFSVCLDGGDFDLSSSLNLLGGTWSGTGISDPNGIFDPLLAGVGPHNLTYTYTDPITNCSNTDILVATVNALPIVNAGNDTTLCNQPLPVQLPSSPIGGVWTGTNVDANGEFTPNGVGVFELVYGFNLAGCDASDTVLITVVDPALADAGLDLELCFSANQTQFIGSPAGGTWSGTGVAGNGNYTPNVPGTYTLTYSFGGGNCLTTDQMELIVHDLPVVNAGVDVSFCESELATNFIGAPLGGTFSGNGITNGNFGTFDPSAATIGANTITYTYTDPITTCTNSNDLIATINPLPNVNFSFNPIICSGNLENFTNNSLLGVDFEWDFGDNTPIDTDIDPIHSFANPGFFDVQLVATSAFSCVDSLTQTIEVRETPTPSFAIATDSACGPLTTSFTNNSTGIGALVYSWDFGNGQTSTLEDPNPVTYIASLSQDTTYYVTMSVTNFCGTVTRTDSVKVMPLPRAIFGTTFNSGCSPYTADFANNSDGLPDVFDWDFGNGILSAQSDSLFSQIFVTGAEDTVYTIRLIVSNECGVDTAFHNLTIYPTSVNAFFNTDATEGCAPLSVNFTNFSAGGEQYNWDLGDGNLSTNANTSNIYSIPGTYLVRMIVNDACSRDTSFATITVHPEPQIDFSFAPNIACEDENFQFTNLSTDISQLSWDFGDGTNSALSNPNHIYTASGNYNVTLSGISTLFACQASITQVVTVSNTPTAQFSIISNDVCNPSPVSFNNTSQLFNFITWDFGDGNISSQVSPTHVYSTPGTYTIELIVENNSGCKDTLTQDIEIFPSPTADFDVVLQNTCNIPVIGTTTNNSSGATDYFWTFGNFQTSTLTNPIVTYDSPAIYNLKLVATNQFGCQDSLTRIVNIEGIPVAAFDIPPYDTCFPSLVSFVNNSENAAFISWDFGDGNISSLYNPSNLYTVPGNYNVKLVVENNLGCVDSLTQLVRVFPVPTADFSFVSVDSCVIPAQVLTINTSFGATNYNWNFGNNFNSTLTNPSVFYDAAGTYFVKLIATNQYGCSDSIIKDITIYSPPIANFVLSDFEMCEGDNFTATSLSLLSDSVRWYMGDGIEYTDNVVNHEYENAGEYFISLVAYGQGTCSDTMFASVPVLVNPTPNANFNYVNVEEEDKVNGTIDFINLSAFADTYYWQLTQDSSTTEINPRYQYDSFGDVYVTLIAYNNNGCQDSIRKIIEIDYFKGLYVPNAVYPDHPSFGVSHFLPAGVGLYTYRITIYDDWGNLLWESTALDSYGRPTEAWDATFQGVPVQQDAYVWKVEATYMTSEFWEGKEYPDGRIKRSGTVTVIR
jgi:PKD repeat protein